MLFRKPQDKQVVCCALFNAAQLNGWENVQNKLSPSITVEEIKKPNTGTPTPVPTPSPTISKVIPAAGTVGSGLFYDGLGVTSLALTAVGTAFTIAGTLYVISQNSKKRKKE